MYIQIERENNREYKRERKNQFAVNIFCFTA